MSKELVQILALITAAQARIAGMQAENQHRLACGNAVAYADEAFGVEADNLERLAIQAVNS